MLVPVRLHEIEKVTRGTSDFKRIVGRTVDLELPGFIIRKSGVHRARTHHLLAAKAVKAAMEKVTGSSVDLFIGEVASATKDLGPHMDSVTVGRKPQVLRAHTLLQGQAGVELAFNGTDNSTIVKLPVFHMGVVDPEIMDRDIYISSVGAGDSTVFFQEDVWHEFSTTSTGPRIYQRSTLVPSELSTR